MCQKSKDSIFGKMDSYKTRDNEYEIQILLTWPYGEPQNKETAEYIAYVSKGGNGIATIRLSTEQENEAIKEGIEVEDYLITQAKYTINQNEFQVY